MAAFAAQVENAPITTPAPEMVETVAPNTVAGAPAVVAPAARVPAAAPAALKFGASMPFAAVSATSLNGLANALGTSASDLLDAMVRAGLVSKAEAARVPL